ncbi:GGDEF domain-containing protein [Solimicrobium silvestre]|uniref:diguanylate cyclase n=1 Tax=Solimicrobium silvestre TaxID=2099400 RepID=A0A2S9GZG9_9BURK|nr:GGDEF domain-containing protein [Solimicrobium silvestre]PRC93132.1 GGDEF: diguanylate cyclase (GGDEF) domain [Solimicrobium silvestre]
MTRSTDSKLLLSLTKLIEKPEIKAFQCSLIQTLNDIISADSITLYEMHTLKKLSKAQAEDFLVRVGYDDRLEKDLPAPMRFSDEAQFLMAYERRDVVIEQIGDQENSLFRCIYPILGIKGVTEFLAIDCKKLIKQEQELATRFIGFYRNYLALLNDNQRDHLTGLLNRKSFDDKMMQIIISLGTGSKRNADKAQYCLALFDIDHFKRVNDTYGHLVGDEVLLHFSQCISETFREYDLLFRVGGEEFVAVIRNVNAKTAEFIMERFRHVIEAYHFPQVGHVTVSIGSTFIAPSDLPVTIMDRADKALYYAKEHGRNQSVIFEQLVASGKLQVDITESDIDLF